MRGAHLQQAARLLVTQAGHELDEGRDLEEVELEDDDEHSPYRTAVAFQVRRADDGVLLLRSANAPNVPLAATTKGFSDSITGGTHWRVYTASDPEHELLFHVAENHATREAIARKVAWRTLAPLLVALPLFGMLVLAVLATKLLNGGWFQPRKPLELDGKPALVFFTLAEGCECEMSVVNAAEAQLRGWSLPQTGDQREEPRPPAHRRGPLRDRSSVP